MTNYKMDFSKVINTLRRIDGEDVELYGENLLDVSLELLDNLAKYVIMMSKDDISFADRVDYKLVESAMNNLIQLDGQIEDYIENTDY